jgi:hypothetical protein
MDAKGEPPAATSVSDGTQTDGAKRLAGQMPIWQKWKRSSAQENDVDPKHAKKRFSRV